MPLALPLSRSPRRAPLLAALALALACAAGAALWAQVDGDRGIAPVAASRDIEVSGIEVDVRADSSEEARAKGWQEAARKAWEKIKGPKIADGQLQSLVSAIVIERERLGPRRYIATLGVVFDRPRAAQYLGSAAEAARSAPLLLIPVMVSGGTATVYETRNPWQRAWAEYNPGASRIDYVRPVGSGGDSLLITYGQTTRRSRLWWRNLLDQYGATDVLTAIARLRHTYPGGPIEGQFTARYGPDSLPLGSFRLTAPGPDQLPAMLAQAVVRFNTIYEGALASGRLTPDTTLNLGSPELDPAIARLVELGRALEARDRAASAAPTVRGPAATDDGTISDAPVKTPPPEGSVALYTVQAATPDADAFDGIVGAVRGASGVRGAGVRSTAVGGTSVLTVSFAGSIDELAAALRARGLTVRQAGNALAVSR